jgi:hypothetical protein
LRRLTRQPHTWIISLLHIGGLRLVGSSDPFTVHGSLWPGDVPERGNLVPAVFQTLEDAVSFGEFKDVMAQLPEEFGALAKPIIPAVAAVSSGAGEDAGRSVGERRLRDLRCSTVRPGRCKEASVQGGARRW